jgi:hypothetical protein
MCKLREHFAVATRLYGEALEGYPTPDECAARCCRYPAACAAALASCGRGQDAGALNAEDRAGLRHQALAWLRADLAMWRREAESESSVAKSRVRAVMDNWLRDPELAGVRQLAALAELPEHERHGWRKLWEDVETVRKRITIPRPARQQERSGRGAQRPD